MIPSHDPFVLVVVFALGWVACHIANWLVHELRMRALNDRVPSLPRSARRHRVGRGLI